MESKSPALSTAPSDQTQPILIELRQTDKARNGTFRPEAYLKLTPALRTSGLLAALPAEELKNLLFLLSYVNPNGDCMPTVTQLAQAMGVSTVKAHARMQRLIRFKWQGEPLAVFLRPVSGIDGYMPNPRLIAYEHTAQPSQEAPDSRPPYRAAGRAAVIAYSRQHYARPRAEVEREMAQRMGWPLPEAAPLPEAVPPSTAANLPKDEAAPPLSAPSPAPASGDSQAAQVRQRLLNLGISSEQTDALLQRFDLLRIQRQLHWLPYRKVRNRAGFLVAAIEDNYEAPPALRQSGSGRANDANDSHQLANL